MKRRVVSVVVSGSGGRAALPDVLARVRAQRLSAEVEVLVPERVGRSTQAQRWNAGMALSRGELVVLLDASALPADPRWLFHLCAPFADRSVAAVVARDAKGTAASFSTCVALSRSAWEANHFHPRDDGRLWVRTAAARGLTVVESSAAAIFCPAPARPFGALVDLLRGVPRLPSRAEPA